MQLKLQLPGVALDPARKVWHQLDRDAQKAVVQALSGTTIKAITQMRKESGEEKDERQN
jgi:hypothetical protein